MVGWLFGRLAGWMDEWMDIKLYLNTVTLIIALLIFPKALNYLYKFTSIYQI